MLAHVLREKGPCLIHALIDANEKVYPMVPPGAANKDMIEGEAQSPVLVTERS
jgi:acetolactate synthase-1/2/3 large subunit